MTLIDPPRTILLDRPPETPPDPLPDFLALKSLPSSWYLICPSKKIPNQSTHSTEILNHQIVLFRTKAGTLHALSAHCSHMGTHLGAGTVVNDCLRCPLHNWSYDAAGKCKTPAPPSANLHQKSYPVAERFGAVFLFLGDQIDAPLPTFESAPEHSLATIPGNPVELQCHWIAIASNAYDIVHLNAVHERALREPPQLQLLDRHRLRLRYLSRVTGSALSDRVMKWLSKDHIRVSITCWSGTLFTVESHAGPTHSMLTLGLLPTKNGVQLTPLFSMKKSPIPFLTLFRLHIARWLFMGFLKKDLATLHAMKFKIPQTNLPAEQTIHQFFHYLRNLPIAPSNEPAISNPQPTDLTTDRRNDSTT